MEMPPQPAQIPAPTLSHHGSLHPSTLPCLLYFAFPTVFSTELFRKGRGRGRLLDFLSKFFRALKIALALEISHSFLLKREKEKDILRVSRQWSGPLLCFLLRALDEGIMNIFKRAVSSILEVLLPLMGQQAWEQSLLAQP